MTCSFGFYLKLFIEFKHLKFRLMPRGAVRALLTESQATLYSVDVYTCLYREYINVGKDERKMEQEKGTICECWSGKVTELVSRHTLKGTM